MNKIDVKDRRLKSSELKEAKKHLLLQQDYLCGLCGTDLSEVLDKDRCLDHCHINGWIRAVLCRNCNSIEGRIRHYANRAKRQATIEEWVAKLMEYWDTYATNEDPIFHPNFRTEDEKRIRRNKKARKRRRLLKKIK